MELTYHVTVVETDGGPEAALRQRLAICAAFRLASLDRRLGHYPQAGGSFDMLDHFTGPFLWERSDEQLADDPPSRVDYEVMAVEPVERPAAPAAVQVQVRIFT